MIKNGSSQDNGHSESSKAASEDTLRDTVEKHLIDLQASAAKYGQASTRRREEELEFILKAFTAAVETAVRTAKIDEQNWFVEELGKLDFKDRIVENMLAKVIERLAEMVGKK